MFVSKERPILVPQSEHQRLAGILARHWGNAEFVLPSINKGSFELGVATHDRAFGHLDTAMIGKISEDEKAKQVDVWIKTAYENLEAELVVLLHVRRLMNELRFENLYNKLDARIQDIVSSSGIDLSEYEKADTITNFCDLIAFDFCFESVTKNCVSLYKDKDTKIDIMYSLSSGKVFLDKWPFDVSKIEGYILGYKQEGYPSDLQPVLIDFEIIQG